MYINNKSIYEKKKNIFWVLCFGTKKKKQQQQQRQTPFDCNYYYFNDVAYKYNLKIYTYKQMKKKTYKKQNKI